MRGTFKSKDHIKNIADQLDVMRKVLVASDDPEVRFRLKIDKDNIFINNADKDDSLFINYRIDPKATFEDYSVVVDEIGIWDVGQFISLLRKYSTKIYKTDAKVKLDFDKNRFIFSCGKDMDEFYTCAPKALRESQGEPDLSRLDESLKFVLKNENIAKLLMNMNIYSEQKNVVFTGKSGATEFQAVVCTLDRANQHTGKIVVEEVEVREDIQISFNKQKLKAILESNDSPEMVLYNSKGSTRAGKFSYSGDNYEMKFLVGRQSKKKV